MTTPNKKPKNIPRRIVNWLRKRFNNDNEETKIFVSLLQPILTFLTASAAIVSLLFSISAFSDQRRSLEVQRQSDMTFRFQQRWQQVEIDMRDRLEKGEVKLDRYLYLYWGIQYDQYVMHKRNNLLPELFATWMAFRRKEYTDNDTIFYIEYIGNDTANKSITYRDGFEKTTEIYDDTCYLNFFRDTVFKWNYKKKLHYRLDKRRHNMPLF